MNADEKKLDIRNAKRQSSSCSVSGNKARARIKGATGYQVDFVKFSKTKSICCNS